MAEDRTPEAHTIHIVTGGYGASAEQVVHTVLAQFPGARTRVVMTPNVRFAEQIDAALLRVQEDGGTLVHTMVDSTLRAHLKAQAARLGLPAIDLMGDLLEELQQKLVQPPLEQPGLYRKLNKAYFDRVAAIEYSMAHDDGRRPQEWDAAEILLTGVSRVGKTPLSLYLSVLGWKVANQPLVPGLALPRELFQIDRGRVIGLTIEAGQLTLLREQRQRRLGAPGASDYTDPGSIFDELEYAESIFHKGGFTIIDVTDKPIETSADEILRLISARYKGQERPG